MALNPPRCSMGWLAKIIKDVAGIPASEIESEKSFIGELEVDSLATVEVIVAGGERFGVTIPDDDAKNVKTVGDAVDFIVLAA
ncbi:MAG TPA: acyl carrier protein [Micromonosporaceae bacterium]|nr:acyl carrier protein [Micromonosporaceae bacterium]